MRGFKLYETYQQLSLCDMKVAFLVYFPCFINPYRSKFQFLFSCTRPWTAVIMTPYSGVVRFYCRAAEDSVLPWNGTASFGTQFPNLGGNVMNSSSGFERQNEKTRLHCISLYRDGNRTNFIQIFLCFLLGATGMPIKLFSRNVLRCWENRSDF